MSIYAWNGSWARWEIREIEYLLKCCKEGTRTEEEVSRGNERGNEQGLARG